MAFRIPVMTKCCFCIPLRIGCLIIGYINLVASCIALAAFSWFICKVHEFVEINKRNPYPNPEHPAADVEREAIDLYICFGYYILAFLFNFILNLTLVVGVHMNNPKILRYYCKLIVVLFALGLGLVVVSSIFLGFLATVGILIWCFILSYITIIVRSSYLDMEERHKPPIQEMQDLQITQQAPLMA